MPKIVPRRPILLFGIASLRLSNAFLYTPRGIVLNRIKLARFATSDTMVRPNLPTLPPSAKRLFLVRHGEVINPGGDRPVYYGGADVPLSELGRQEAVAAAEFLAQFALDHVFCSPLSRALYGAEQVVKAQSKPRMVEQISGFTELDRGDWYGMTKEEIGDLMDRFDACDPSVTPEGGEYYPDFKSRVLQARDEALSRMKNGEVACVVSHLQVTRSMLSDALSIPTEKMAGIKVATASVTCIDYDASGQTVHFQSYKPEVGLVEAKDGAN